MIALSNKFNKNEFADLLKIGKGRGRTQSQFAKDANISIAHMNKLLNAKFDKPPSPSTIKKIADCSINNVSYNDLMIAAGYDDEQNNIISKMLHNNAEQACNKIFLTSIIGSMSGFSFNWAVSSQYRDFNLSLNVESSLISLWLFDFNINLEDEISNTNLANRIISYYGKLAMKQLPPSSKYSIVTSNENDYLYILNTPARNLNVLASVIFIDIETLSVKKEDYLQTSKQVNNETRESCSFQIK